MITPNKVRVLKKDIVYFFAGTISGFIIYALIRILVRYYLGAAKDEPLNIYNHIYRLAFSKLSEYAFELSGKSLLVAHWVGLINIALFMFICGIALVIIRRLIDCKNEIGVHDISQPVS